MLQNGATQTPMGGVVFPSLFLPSPLAALYERGNEGIVLLRKKCPRQCPALMSLISGIRRSHQGRKREVMPYKEENSGLERPDAPTCKLDGIATLFPSILRSRCITTHYGNRIVCGGPCLVAYLVAYHILDSDCKEGGLGPVSRSS